MASVTERAGPGLRLPSVPLALRVQEKNKPGLGTTRHFDVTKRAIETRMGTSPHLPIWATLATDVNAVEYGKMTVKEQSIENTLKATLIAAVSGLDGVSVADISGVVAGHEFCTSDPWTYGISVLRWNDASLAPFHPIPQAQAAIAAVLKQSFPQQ